MIFENQTLFFNSISVSTSLMGMILKRSTYNKRWADGLGVEVVGDTLVGNLHT